MCRILCIPLTFFCVLALAIFLGWTLTSPDQFGNVAINDGQKKLDVIGKPAKAEGMARAEPGKGESPLPAGPHNEDISSLVKGNTQFAFDLYHHFRKQEGNIVFSPFSISSALAMACAGVTGKEAKQFAKVLGFPPDAEESHQAFANLKRKLNFDATPDKFQLSIANALWGQEGLSFRKPFLARIEKYYDGELNFIDFTSNPELASQLINEWVKKKTKNLMPDMLSPGIITPDTRLVLGNAIYFKARWRSSFLHTKEKVFHCNEKESIPVIMMHGNYLLNYFSGKDFHLLELPYNGDRFVMLFILPKQLHGLADLEGSLSPSVLSTAVARLTLHMGEVMIPRFSMTFKVSLKEYLATQGMPIYFPGIVEGVTLTLDKILHRAIIIVNKTGTEAAAATLAGFSIRAIDYPSFSFLADRPFLFIIRDKQTDSILFMGRVANPSV